MRKGFVWLYVSIFFFVSSLSFSAVKKTLIDFNVYEQNIAKVVEKDKKIHDEAVQKGIAPDLTQYGYPKVEFTPDDWTIDKWKVILCPSANTVRNNILSYTKKVPSKRFGDVLGVRIHFIEGRFLSWALISPPFDFYPFYDDGSEVSRGPNNEENGLVMGLLMNVGQIKSLSGWVYGLNYQMQTGIRLKDRNDLVHDYFLGSVFFDGWRKLVWNNPEYTDQIQDKVLQRVALYPKSYPYIYFDSYVVYKPEQEPGGDFVIYFKDVEMEYDRAIVTEEMDIEDEAIWGILAKERSAKRLRDLKTIGERIYLYQKEMRKQKLATEQTPSSETKKSTEANK